MFEPWKNGNIEDVEIRVGEGGLYGPHPHYQVDVDADEEAIAFLNAALEAFHSTERIGPAPKDSNDPARYRPIRSVLINRYVDDRDRVYYSVVASQ